MAATVHTPTRQERTADSLKRLADLNHRAKRTTALEYARLNPVHTSLHQQIDDALDELGL